MTYGTLVVVSCILKDVKWLLKDKSVDRNDHYLITKIYWDTHHEFGTK